MLFHPRFAMTVLLVTLGLTPPALTATLTLQNGREVTPYPTPWGNDRYGYYGTLDTVISPDAPDANFGRALEIGLVGGSQQRVLIQFRELNRAIGPNKQITAATLRLHTVPGAWNPSTAEVRVFRVLHPWRQGGANGAPQYWTATWNARMASDDPDRALSWIVPGAAGVGTDRAATATAVTTTTANYNAAQGTWLITGLGPDVQDFYTDVNANFGWIIEFVEPANATGENRFYASEHPIRALRPELIITYFDAPPAARDLDLDVGYIERTPEYLRYNPAYESKQFHNEGVGLMKNPGFANVQKWPANGATVTFTAHVFNKGLSQASGPFGYRWLIDGQVVATGIEPVGLVPGARTTYALNWVWDCDDFPGDLHRLSADNRDRTVTFEVDYEQVLVEQNRHNNALTDYMKAPGLGFYVEQSMYDMFHATQNQMGSYSFEAWLQWKIRVWNESYFEMSRFPDFGEDGALERVRIQRIEVWPDGTLDPGGNHIPMATGTNYLLDGEWGFRPDQGYVNKWSKMIEWALLHECMHQLGKIDLYTMNMDAGTPSNPLKVQVKDGRPYYLTRGYFPPWGGLMGGGDTRYASNYEGTGLLAGWDVGAISANVGYRRGFYGEQIYDLPETVKLRALDAGGAPIPFASFKIWQSRSGLTPDESLYSWQPIFAGQADADGVVTLPNVGTLDDGFTTLTGHTLRPNPWGRVHVVGLNGSFLVRVDGYGQQDYTFVRVIEANVRYWAGETDETTLDLPVQIAPTTNLGLQNLALGRPASSNVGGTPSLATDGNLNTRWDPGNTGIGAYLQVDLGAVHDIAKIVLVHNGFGGDFFQRFRVELSHTGTFNGEQSLFAREDVSWGIAIGTRRDIDPVNEQLTQVAYAGVPTPGRYLRITCEAAHWTKLSELQVYPALPGEDITPPATITDLSVQDVGATAAVLTWTTPGDDGMLGTASGFDPRYATTPITSANFAQATAVPNPPTPVTVGAPVTYFLSDLTPHTTYWFAVRAVDDVGNWSELSNVVLFSTTSLEPDVALTTRATPHNSSWASSLASDGQTLYFLRRDSLSFYGSPDGGQNWSPLPGPQSALGGSHGDWASGVLAHHTGSGEAGSLYLSHRDSGGTQRLARYDLASDSWLWTDRWVVFSHGMAITGNHLFGIARAWGWNTGGAVQRHNLADPFQVFSERSNMANIQGEAHDWFSRATQLAARDGWVYAIKNDWTSPQGTGDRVFGFATAHYDPSILTGTLPADLTNWGAWQGRSTPAVDFGQLPFEIGYGAALVALPPHWSADVGSQGGLFILAGSSPANNEGWGNPSALAAVFDLATRSFKLVALPGTSGTGGSAVFHDGAVYVKRGESNGNYNNDLWILAPSQSFCPGDMNCDTLVNFADISLFIAAIKAGSPANWTYDPAGGVCAYENGDLNGDGLVNFADISGFIAAIKAAPPPCATRP